MLNKLFTFLLLALPILDVYGIGITGFSIGKILLLLVSLILVIKDRLNIKLYFNKFFIILLTLLVVVSFILNISEDWFSIKDYIHKLIAIGGFYFTLCLALQYVDWDRALKYYKILVWICSIFFFIQFSAFYFAEIRIIGIIPHIPLAIDRSSTEIIEMQENLSRFTSFFLEPAHFAYYIAIYYIILAFREENPFTNKEFLFLSLVLLLLQSGNGLMIMGVVVIISTFKILLSKQSKKGTNIFIVLLLFIVGGITFSHFSNNEAVNKNLGRINEISFNQDNKKGSSGYQRIFSGYTFLSEVEQDKLWLGLGLGNQNAYYHSHDMPTFRSETTNADSQYVYLNSIQLIIAWGGVVSLLFFGLYTYRLTKNNTLTGRTMMIAFIISCFIASGLFGTYMLFFLLFSIHYQRVRAQQIS